MSMRRYLVLVAAVMLLLAPSVAYSWTHVARDGERLEQLAVRYYGRPGMSMVIRAANGFVHPDDGRSAAGERIEIPEVFYYQIRGGETWERIANIYLASSKRARFLCRMNGYGEQVIPPRGTIIKIPYHLRHIFARGESLKSVTKIYYGKERSSRWLRRYNLTAKKKFSQGDVIIVPLVNLEFTKDEQERIEAERANRFSSKDVKGQDMAMEGIAKLKVAFEEGKYVEMVAVAHHLLNPARLTVPQQIGIYNYLAFAYVALGEKKLAIEAFEKSLEHQPTLELSPITTSPKILEVFRQAKVKMGTSDKSPSKQ